MTSWRTGVTIEAGILDSEIRPTGLEKTGRPMSLTRHRVVVPLRRRLNRPLAPEEWRAPDKWSWNGAAEER
jgi:hypothetical protein